MNTRTKIAAVTASAFALSLAAAANPVRIPRNHRVQQVIDAGVKEGAKLELDGRDVTLDPQFLVVTDGEPDLLTATDKTFTVI